MKIVRKPDEPLYAFKTRRRQEAARLFQDTDWTLTDIADDIGVTRKYISFWHSQWQTGDLTFLTAQKSGKKSYLTDEQRERLRSLIIARPLAAGYDQQLWTQKRIAELIQKEFGVSYRENGVGILMASMQIRCQKPARQTRQRSESALRTFRETTWVDARKAFVEHATFVFCDETGIQLTPNVCRTWAPRGCTPVLAHEKRKGKPA